MCPGQSGYRRNYVNHRQVLIPQGFTGEVEYDVVTEVFLDDHESFERTMAKAADPQIAARIANDEANFLDRESMRFFVVEARQSDIQPV